MHSALEVRHPIDRRKFVRYLGFHASCFVVFVIPYLWADKHTALFLMLGYIATMLIFEHRTTHRIIEPSEELPAGVRAEVRRQRHRNRDEKILAGAFFPATCTFIFLAPKSNEMYATHDWTTVVGLVVFAAVNILMTYDKVRQ